MKCIFCNKKCGLMVFNCKCGLQGLCITCKHPEIHNCKYDYKDEHKKKISNQNLVVIKEKINKI